MLRHSAGVVPHIIRALTHSYWDHAGWVASTQEVLESGWRKGVAKAPLSKFALGDTRKCRVVRLEDVEYKDVLSAVELAETHIGKPYDFKLIFHLLLVYLGNYWKEVKAHDWECGFVCSELIAKPLWEAARFKFRDDVPVGNITPGDIDFSPKTVEVLIRALPGPEEGDQVQTGPMQ